VTAATEARASLMMTRYPMRRVCQVVSDLLDPLAVDGVGLENGL
jgi:hypothetical protein